MYARYHHCVRNSHPFINLITAYSIFGSSRCKATNNHRTPRVILKKKLVHMLQLPFHNSSGRFRVPTRDMHCCGTSRREGSNVSNPERKRTKSLASNPLTVGAGAPENLPTLWSGTFGKRMQVFTIVLHLPHKGWLVWASVWLLQLRGIDTKEIKVWFGL